MKILMENITSSPDKIYASLNGTRELGSIIHKVARLKNENIKKKETNEENSKAFKVHIGHYDTKFFNSNIKFCLNFLFSYFHDASNDDTNDDTKSKSYI